MGWSKSQQNRLMFEKQIMDRLFPQFEVKSPLMDTYWIGEMKTNSGKQYTIRINIPAQYPEQAPDICIVAPSSLYTYTGKKLQDMGCSHEMHTFTPENGYVKMCLFRTEYWSAEYTLTSCLRKARIWLEAYDEHLKSGKKMCDILGTQQVD